MTAGRLVEILQSLLRVSSLIPRHSPVVKRGGIVGLETDCLMVIPQRTVQVAFCEARLASVNQGREGIGFEPDSLL